MSLIGRTLSIAVWGIAWSGLSFAYIPPSHFIVKSIASKHAGPRLIRVRGQVTALENDKPTGVHFKTVTYFNPQTRELKSWAMDDANQKLYLLERKTDKDKFPAGAEILFETVPKTLGDTLKEKGVPIRSEDELTAMASEVERRTSETEFLSRWKNTVAWVVGKRDKSDTQLWVEKDSFFPIRLLLADKFDDEVAELQFEGFKYYKDFPYPKVTLGFKKGSVAVLRDDFTDLVAATDFKDKDFKETTATPGFTDAGNSAPGALRELITLYYKTLR
jgi:hypothetical protein